ncbi:MAG: hypothetical protein RR585_10400, partial [Coprobacillus sp.]
EYPLSQAINDGYTRTPYAITRSNINFYNFDQEQLDKLMLLDGIMCHERTKQHLLVYANNSNKEYVKPFMMVVCSDTEHADKIDEYLRSDEFKEGYYKNRTITVHSKKSGSETEENTKLLLAVERNDNPIEIVIHVNKLKEGWDVNNLYTIVPLRTATSKILREQMVGRGLRLPYGELTGDKEIDAVMIAAHDKFDDILREAQKADSLFKAGNVIKAEDMKEEFVEFSQLNLLKTEQDEYKEIYDATKIAPSVEVDKMIDVTNEIIANKLYNEVSKSDSLYLSKDQVKTIIKETNDELYDNTDLGVVFKSNEDPFSAWISSKVEKSVETIGSQFIPIPRIKVTDLGPQNYVFVDFELNCIEFFHAPIENNILIQNLENSRDKESIMGDRIDFEGFNPKKVLLELLRDKPEIDYENCSELLIKLIVQVCEHYEKQYGENGLKNIIMMYRRDISN